MNSTTFFEAAALIQVSEVVILQVYSSDVVACSLQATSNVLLLLCQAGLSTAQLKQRLVSVVKFIQRNLIAVNAINLVQQSSSMMFEMGLRQALRLRGIKKRNHIEVHSK